MGAGNVGKTCLIVQLISGKFVESYDPTLEDSYRRQISVGEKEVVLDIFDTAGQEDFSAVRDSYMTTGDGFMIIYSIIDDKTYQEVSTIHSKLLLLHDNKKVPGIIIGNKCDLEDKRIVPTNQGQALAEKFAWSFLETSAKTKINVLESFQEVTKLIMEFRVNNASVSSSTSNQASARDNTKSPNAQSKERRSCILF